MSNPESAYPAAERITIAETPTLRVRLLALAEGQSVPWHYHGEITDTFFCMEGPMQVMTRNPDETHVLDPGETCAVAPGTPHHVSGAGGLSCRFMLVQGVGAYDFIPVGD